MVNLHSNVYVNNSESMEKALYCEKMRKCCNTVNKKTENKKMKNCMVCGKKLNCLTESVKVSCMYCGREEKGYFLCPAGHYVCEDCHGKDAFESIKHIAMSTKEKNPLIIAEIMMRHPSIPMLGCEHAFIAASAFMSSLRNANKFKIKEEQITEAMTRARAISKSGYCGLAGACGIASGLGAAFSVLLGATCSKDREMFIVLHTHAEATKAIANTAGPCCCKRFMRDALDVGRKLARTYLKTNIPISRTKISCSFSGKHPHCKRDKCNYFVKE